MPVVRLRRLNGWHAIVLPNPLQGQLNELSDSDARLNDLVPCEDCGRCEAARDMDNTWFDRYRGHWAGLCSQCTGNYDNWSDADIVDNFKFKAAKKRAAKKTVARKPASKTKKAMKVKEATKKARKAKSATKTKKDDKAKEATKKANQAKNTKAGGKRSKMATTKRPSSYGTQ